MTNSEAPQQLRDRMAKVREARAAKNAEPLSNEDEDKRLAAMRGERKELELRVKALSDSLDRQWPARNRD